MRNRQTAGPATLDECRHLLERLCRGIESVERTFSKLAERIEPWDTEHASEAPSWVDLLFTAQGPRTIGTLVEIARSADRHLLAVEMHGNAIRAKITEIADDIMSREELKKHLRGSHC